MTGWRGHLPGQHVDIRLTAEDGYQALRSYSIASPPEDDHLTLTVERVDDGEVSPYLLDHLRTGDRFELRGPIGGYFVWTSDMGGPLYLIAGGSGIAPLMAMLRHRRKQNSYAPTLLLYSSQKPWTMSSTEKNSTQWRTETLICGLPTRLHASSRRDGPVTGEELTKRSSRRRPSCLTRIQRYLSAAPLLWLKPRQGFWLNLVMTPSPSRQSASDLQEASRHE